MPPRKLEWRGSGNRFDNGKEEVRVASCCVSSLGFDVKYQESKMKQWGEDKE